MSSSFSPSPSGSTAPSDALVPYGWDSQFADSFAPFEAEGFRPVRVLRVDRGRCQVMTAEGPEHAGTEALTAADPAAALCTGDWAVLGADSRGEPQLRALLPRRTAFVRATSTKRSEGQVLAANVDHALIAVSLAVDLDLTRLERFVSLAWSSGAQPLVLLTKADLVPDGDVLTQLLADAEGVAPGVQVLACSATTGAGMDVLRAVLSTGTTVLLGVSGAGKSTLANALLGEDAQEVAAIREQDGKGRHTTTTRDLLPLPGGGVLIDTPGLRGVGLWDAEDGLGQAFAEIEELAAECRFHDCAHESEPGCAVLAAIDDGSLAQRRLTSYRKLLRENARIAARTDARLAAQQKQKFKQRQALGQHMMERKRGPRKNR